MYNVCEILKINNPEFQSPPNKWFSYDFVRHYLDYVNFDEKIITLTIK